MRGIKNAGKKNQLGLYARKYYRQSCTYFTFQNRL